MDDLYGDEIRVRLIDILWEYSDERQSELNNLNVKGLLDVVEERLKYLEKQVRLNPRGPSE